MQNRTIKSAKSETVSKGRAQTARKKPFLPKLPSQLFDRTADDVQKMTDRGIVLQMSQWYEEKRYRKPNTDLLSNIRVFSCSACLGGATLLSRVESIPENHLDYLAVVGKLEKLYGQSPSHVKFMFDRYRVKETDRILYFLNLLYPSIRVEDEALKNAIVHSPRRYKDTITKSQVADLIEDLRMSAQNLRNLGY